MNFSKFFVLIILHPRYFSMSPQSLQSNLSIMSFLVFSTTFLDPIIRLSSIHDTTRTNPPSPHVVETRICGAPHHPHTFHAEEQLTSEWHCGLLKSVDAFLQLQYHVIWVELLKPTWHLGKTRQTKRLSSILIVQSRISGNLLSSSFI